MSASASTVNAYARSTGQSRSLVLDPWIIGTVAALLLIGLVMVASASIGISEKETGAAFHYFVKQLMFVGLGLVAAGIGLAVPTRIWDERSTWLLIGAFVLLVLVLVPGIGYVVNGSRRWIRLGFMNFQVSEAARVMLLMYVSSYAVRRADELRTDFKGFMVPVGVLGAAAVLLLCEPDFGAATVLLATGIGVLFLAGARVLHLLVPVLVGSVGLAALALISPYRMRRLTGFLDPWGDPFDSGFQLSQSLIAIGRGEWFGVGLGASVQKLFYLPEAHTDFVFAVLAEEFGFVGVLVVVSLFALLVTRALMISREAAQAGQTFQSYVAASIGIWIGLQAFVNIGVNMGLLPTKGLTLPLLSYGGSSMLVTLGWLGVLLRINHDTQATGRVGKVSRTPREGRRA
jgi:cell division protein FtsW